MKLVVDVHYKDDEYAVASGLLFADWQSPDFVRKESVKVDAIKPYKPGSFFERELPCIVSLLNAIDESLNFIIIDGYVTLGPDKREGLGMHLYRAINARVPVIGVAKNRFSDTPKGCQVFRGESKNPLYVTSAGIPLTDAKAFVASMHGKFRVPTLLKRVDAECRKGIAECGVI